jgi:hypothetical protein
MCKSSLLNVDAFSLLEIPTVLLRVLQSLDSDTHTAPIIIVAKGGGDAEEGDHEKLKLGRQIVQLLSLLMQHHTSTQTLTALLSCLQDNVYPPQPPLSAQLLPQQHKPLLGL